MKTTPEFHNRQKGKSLAQMYWLLANIKAGNNCLVATLNPQKTKNQFKYVVGEELILTPLDDSEYFDTNAAYIFKATV